jgi:DNA phosphorothioation-associated putative methyltransferase
MSLPSISIPRHKAAIRRGDLSRPIKYGPQDGLIDPTTTGLDFGCGRGEDVALLRARGFLCEGWDPAFFAAAPKMEADVVNLGYVINVIEDPRERAATFQEAWGLCRCVLVVAAQPKGGGPEIAERGWGDGILRRHGPFQKFFEQGELRSFLETELGAEAIPASLGAFCVFKDEALGEQLRASRFRRRSAAPRIRLSVQRFEENRDLLEPLMAAIADLGRLPQPDEFPQAPAVLGRFGSLARDGGEVLRRTDLDPLHCAEVERSYHDTIAGAVPQDALAPEGD